MKNEQTVLYQITETSRYMMGSLLVTRENNAIVIDGGRPEDMPLLKKYIGGRHISAWILTHAHSDHISGLVDELAQNGAAAFNIERVYYNFPPITWLDNHDVPDYGYFKEEVEEMIPAWDAVLPKLDGRTHIVRQGESVTVDEVKIDFLYTWHEGLYANPMNDASTVFKITAPHKTVLFLGDLGPDGGDVLFRESRHLLKSDIVQMAHHGHMNVSMEVYAEIMPEACLWCCPDWLYEEPEVPKYLSNVERLTRMKRIRMYGTALTRKWMDILGVKTHYVTKDGTNTIIL